MLIGFIILIIVSVLCAVIPWYFNSQGFNVPEFILNMLGGFIGSSFALIGSVSFQLISDKRKSKSIYEKSLLLLKRELYNNFIVCIQRLTNNNCNIAVFDEAYRNFISTDDVLRNQNKIYSELSNLYFIITRGEQTLKSLNTFLTEINLQKKQPKSYCDVKDIVQSTGIDYIYEFAILRYIILLNKNQGLKIKLPFDDFEKLVKYEQAENSDIEECILLYIVELLCKKLFNNDGILYYRQYLHEKECKNVC